MTKLEAIKHLKPLPRMMLLPDEHKGLDAVAVSKQWRIHERIRTATKI